MVYLLYHKRLIEEEMYDEKFIGIYSTYDIAINTKNKYLSICGFKDYQDGFYIEHLEVEGKKNNGEQKYVYYVEYQNPNEEYEPIVHIGAFGTRLAAIIGILKYSIKTGTRIPCTRYYLKKGFYLDKYYLDENEWIEGFVDANLDMEEL